MDNYDPPPASPRPLYPIELRSTLWSDDSWQQRSTACTLRSITRYSGARKTAAPMSGHPYWELAFSFDGGGLLQLPEQSHSIGGEAAWVLPPELPHRETTDRHRWDILWLAYTGTDLEHLRREPTILHDASSLSAAAELLWTWERRQVGVIGPELEALGTFLLRAVLRQAANADSSGSDDWLQRTLGFIHEHLADPLELDDLAAAAGFSAGHFQRCFKAVIGVTPWQYLTRERLQLALAYLQESHYSISEIATRVGYDDAMYFSRVFRKQFGIAPSQWRRRTIDKFAE